MALRIEPLGRQHRRLLSGFRNQHPSLVEYLRRYALRHGQTDLLSRTHLAIDDSDGADRVAGYFSLAFASVERESATAIASLDRLPRFPIPAILLAQLAVDDRVQGQGLGRYLFEPETRPPRSLSLRRLSETRRRPPLGAQTDDCEPEPAHRGRYATSRPRSGRAWLSAPRLRGA